jgi:hypothetical protein
LNCSFRFKTLSQFDKLRFFCEPTHYFYVNICCSVLLLNLLRNRCHR